MADIHIYFGSQSGTAESFSDDLKEEVENNGMTAEVIDLQSFTPESFAASSIAVMVVATYGDGEPTDNAVAFHKWAMNPKHDGALKGQRFAVMGLGDMNYSRFNNMGQLTDLNLERLGGTRIYKRGVGDDSQDIVEDFEKWRTGGLIDQLKAAVEEVKKEGPRAAPAAPKATNGKDKESNLPFGTPIFEIAKAGAELGAESDGEPMDIAARFYFEAEKAKIAKVKELRQLRNIDEGLSTMEVEIEATGSLQSYTTAGTLALLPRNSPTDVLEMLKFFGLAEADLARQLTFKAAEGMRVKKPFPTPCSLGDALFLYCDLARAPNKKMLSAMQANLPGEAKSCVGKLIEDSEALKMLQAESACCRMHEFWALMGITGLDLGEFLLNCPRQKPREYTIASSPNAAPKRITLCVSLTSHEADLKSFSEKLITAGCLPASSSASKELRRKTLGGLAFQGLCSRWISTELKEGETVLAKHHPSTLKLPSKDVPIVMVGAGAGVAPFRAFWEDLRRGPQVAPAALFFGCRHPEQDWLFKDEMSGAVKLGGGCAALSRMQVGPKRPIASLFTAFSRPGEGKEKCYVQDAIKQQGPSVKAWVQNMEGYIFICGSTAMGNGVLDALAEVLEGGKETVEALRGEGRIVAEMWG